MVTNKNIVGPKMPIPKIPSEIILEGLRKAISWLKKIWGKKKPLDEKKSTADDIQDISRAMSEYRLQVEKSADALEKQVQERCKKTFQEMLESLKLVNQSLKVFREESFERKLDYLMEDIEGFFGRFVAKRISLDDVECVNVLKMMPGNLKSQRIEELQNKVLREAMDSLGKSLQRFKNDFYDSLEISIDSRMDGLEERIQEKREAYRKLQEAQEADGSKKEAVALKAAYLYSNVGILEFLDEGRK